MNFLSRLFYRIRKPNIIVVTKKGSRTASEAIYQVLRPYFKVKKIKERLPSFFEIWSKRLFIIETELTGLNKKNLRKLLRFSSMSILVVTHIGDIPFDSIVFSGNRKETKEIKKLAKKFPQTGFVISNYDDEAAREITDKIESHVLTFGFEKESDLQATDTRINGGTNFKINHKGNITPVWQERIFGKEQIYSSLVAAAVGVIFGLNFVKISKSLSNYKSLPGKMRLIEGINNSSVLDDSDSASVFSMTEALQILGKIESKRRIAVLGDVLGVGRYTIEAHETIGERVNKNSDILFTVGARAKFIGEGAKRRGMEKNKIYQLDTIKDLIPYLKKEIKKGDLILVDGSRKMEMGKIIEEIKI